MGGMVAEAPPDTDEDPSLRVTIPVLFLLAPLLAACETSSRLPPFSNPFGGSDRVGARPAPAPSPRIDAVPTEPVQSAPLPAPVTRQDLAPPPGMPAEPQLAQQMPSLPTTPGVTPGTATPGTTPNDPVKTAKVEPPKVPADDAPVARPTQSSVTGNWNAREATGGSCKVTLSSSPKLDLYNASTSGCQSKDLQRVTAWELRGEDVYLYEPGGAVAARLKAGGRSMNGALAKTGAPVTLSK